MAIYFGFAIADSMFVGDVLIKRTVLTANQVQEMARDGALTPCLNPSHAATIDAMKRRYDIDVEIPETPPQVKLDRGDALVIMGVRGLPRLVDRHEYTPEEIASATFSFARYDVV